MDVYTLSRHLHLRRFILCLHMHFFVSISKTVRLFALAGESSLCYRKCGTSRKLGTTGRHLFNYYILVHIQYSSISINYCMRVRACQGCYVLVEGLFSRCSLSMSTYYQSLVWESRIFGDLSAYQVYSSGSSKHTIIHHSGSGVLHLNYVSDLLFFSGAELWHRANVII